MKKEGIIAFIKGEGGDRRIQCIRCNTNYLLKNARIIKISGTPEYDWGCPKCGCRLHYKTEGQW